MIRARCIPHQLRDLQVGQYRLGVAPTSCEPRRTLSCRSRDSFADVPYSHLFLRNDALRELWSTMNSANTRGKYEA